MSLKDWHVLIVEDEFDSRELVQAIFEYHGIGCVAATTAEEALDILENVVPTLIIIDLALPGMDGWSLLKAVRQMPELEGVPCVAITAYHSFETADRAIEEGFDAYFPKPIEATAFVRELEYIVNGGQ
jgi:CheY-like chemotaxis protein